MTHRDEVCFFRYNFFTFEIGFFMFKYFFLSFSFLLYFSSPIFADDETLYMLNELQVSTETLKQELKVKKGEIKKTLSQNDSEILKNDIKNLSKQIDELETKFSKIATGIDVSAVKRNGTEVETTLSEDFQLLIKPLIQSAKDGTKEMREKAYLQEEIEEYKSILPKATKAHANVQNLLTLSKDKELTEELKALEVYWKQQIQLLSSKLNASLHQIATLEKNSVSFSSSLKENSKNFFQARGFVLFKGVMGTILLLLLMRFLYFILIKVFPIFTKPSRSFSIRFIDLLYKALTISLAIIVPMTIFYIEDDSFLFSIGVLLFLGMLWAFRNLIANLWQQARLFLNIGSVREEERIFFEGLPWKVKNINVFTIIENPTTGMQLRVPIEKLVGLNSRPAQKHEPWFPCTFEEWVILSDGYYGRMIGISPEFVELENLGGGRKTYLVADFLALSPLNLSSDMRLVETFGISYKHQKESTRIIPNLLQEFLLKKFEEEDYMHGLIKLLVQFKSAGDSSLNLAIIVNLRGDMAGLYYKIQRDIQRWCVEASNEYNWEIPFPQLTIHQGGE
ncbi:MAG: Unknown protein [uncultured Sulfurovum sp.]|uniref:Mechanosensitive ion channel n=1 Tax=uncultured Sulfurovum sp. TaxID=269237 RepID=A0A6S6TCJ6_9BACT|nr:MAG: Unknown protein [uncultured Sulfurovum sp.]